MRWWHSEDGQGLTEYGLLLALIAAVLILAAIAMGGTLKHAWEYSRTAITNALTGSGS